MRQPAKTKLAVQNKEKRRMPNTFLILSCMECHQAARVQFVHIKHSPFGKSNLYLTLNAAVSQLRTSKWFLSAVSPIDEDEITLAPVCDQCASKVYSSEIVDKAASIIDNKGN